VVDAAALANVLAMFPPLRWLGSVGLLTSLTPIYRGDALDSSMWDGDWNKEHDDYSIGRWARRTCLRRGKGVFWRWKRAHCFEKSKARREQTGEAGRVYLLGGRVEEDAATKSPSLGEARAC